MQWPGRLQVLRREPLMIIDGAHNAYSMKLLGEALRKYFRFDRLLTVCADISMTARKGGSSQ